MTNPVVGNPPIIVGVDGSEQASDAVRWAVSEAARHDAPLLVLHGVLMPELYFVGSPDSALLAPAKEEGERIVRRASELAKSHEPEVEVRTEAHIGLPARLLIERSGSARMIVLGSRGAGGFGELLVGSTTAAVASHAHCATVVVRGSGIDVERPADAPVVVGVDASPVSDAAIGMAFEAASSRNAPLIAVHTWSDSDGEAIFSPSRMNVSWESIDEAERRMLAERLAGWHEKYPDVTVRQVVTRDRPRHELLEWSKKAQLVAVGSRGRGGFTGLLLGSTSQALIHHAHCPVLVARPDSATE
ncbi:MAG: universal stress protein [Pseudonocardiaceae bacterium]|nr:universal stress protein [Pseudonocardiaceae bacterium]